MSLLPPYFPIAPKEYNQDEERAFRGKVSEAIGQRLGVTDIPVYGGVPFTSMLGTDAAFSVASGLPPTVLPFNTILQDTDPLVTLNTSTFTVTALVDCTLMNWLRIKHDAGGGGNLTVTLWGNYNGTFVEGSSAQINNNQAANFQSTAQFKLFVGDTLAVALSHTFNSPILANMVESRWYIERWTPDPRLIGNERF